MEALTFTLSGKTAFFKKPDVNNYAYFTYNNIHKVALLGLLGSILGLGGYNQQEGEYPEFYDRLKNLKVSIVPLAKKGYFNKKIQTYNNTTGYYNKGADGFPCSLNVREQWLQDVSWQIYILNDNSIDTDLFNKLKDYIVNRKCEFIPYLGKNDHPATIKNGKVIPLDIIENVTYIDSLFKDKDVKLSSSTTVDHTMYEFKESMPIGLSAKLNHYIMDVFTFTNRSVENYSINASIYKGLHHILYFS